MNHLLSFLLVYYNIFLGASIVILALKNLVIRDWTKPLEFFLISWMLILVSASSLLYSFEPGLALGLWVINIVILLFSKKAFPHHSLSGLLFYSANYLMMIVGLIWGTNFIANLDVSFITKTLLMISAPLVVVTFPSGIIQVIELYDVLCRDKWLRPRRAYPFRTKNTNPMVSLHVPTYSEPPELVIQTLNKLAKLDYENYEVMVIDNNTPDSSLYLPVAEHCAKLGKNFKFFHQENLPGAKAGALNFILPFVDPKAEIVGVIDADYHAQPNFLRALVGHFDDPKVGFVQTPHDYRGWQNNAFLTMCYWEYKIFFYSVLVSLNERESAITVGTMCLIRKQALLDAGGWAEWCVTEDSELAIRIHDSGYSSVYVPVTFGHGLIPDTFEGYKKQRYRWTAGPVQEFMYHAKHFVGLTDKESAFSLKQRIHHLNHGLNNVIIGLTLPLMALGLAVISSLVLHQEVVQVPFELWLAATVMMLASYILDILVNKAIINPSLLEVIGKTIASKALSYVIILSSFRTLLTGNAAWNRTNKFKSLHSYSGALYSTKEEIILGIAMLSFVCVAYSYLPYSGLALMFLIGLVYSAMSFFAAPLISLISVWSLSRE
jgi:cellulose synthase/poly-beta-1,6-N-acetylglucosamine synthase-like glycosyltransferase